MSPRDHDPREAERFDLAPAQVPPGDRDLGRVVPLLMLRLRGGTEERVEKAMQIVDFSHRDDIEVLADRLRSGMYGGERLAAGDKLYAFDSRSGDGFSKTESSPYWLTERELRRLCERYVDGNGTLDVTGVKNELALPCPNRCDVVVTRTVAMEHEGFVTRAAPATENVYVDTGGLTVLRDTRSMDGGARQVIPDLRKLDACEKLPEFEQERLYRQVDYHNHRLEAQQAEARKLFAREARGEVDLSLIGTREQWREALPPLLGDERVTTVNGIGRDRLVYLYERDPNEALCELYEADDRRRALESGERDLLRDVDARERPFEKMRSDLVRSRER